MNKGDHLKGRTFFLSKVLYHLACFIEYYDYQSLPACMRAFEVTLGFSPNDLATVAAIEAIAMLSSSPIWGIFTDLYEPKFILGFAMVLSGTMSMCLAFMNTFVVMVIFRMINGIAMGSIAPVTQRLLLATTDAGNRGLGFGILHATFCFGRLAGNVITTHLSLETVFGFRGWSVCFFCFGFLEVVLGIVIFVYMKRMKEPKEIEVIESGDVDHVETKSIKSMTKKAWNYIRLNVREIFYTKTSIVLFVKTFVADAPFIAFAFLTMYLQYLGLSNLMAGVVAGMALVGGLIGGILGGYLVDVSYSLSPKFGRITTGIISLTIRLVALFVIFFWAFRQRTNKVGADMIILFIILGITGMNVNTIDRPLLASVILPKYHASAIAFSRGFAGIASNVVFYKLTAWLATDVFGYESTTLEVRDMPQDLLAKNSNAYRVTMLYVATFGTIASALTYVLCYFVYPKDSELTEKRIREMEEQEGEKV